MQPKTVVHCLDVELFRDTFFSFIIMTIYLGIGSQCYPPHRASARAEKWQSRSRCRVICLIQLARGACAKLCLMDH